MAQKTTTQLQTVADAITNETEIGGVTKSEVGGLFSDMAESAANKNDTEALNLATAAFSITGQAKGGDQNIAFSSTPDFDLDEGNFQRMVVTAAVTSLAISNEVNGSSYCLILEIGGSGSYAIPQAGATFGSRTDNSVDDSVSSWYPTTVGSKIIYTIGIEPNGDTFYSIETITV